jgi:hypothetical protein
MESSFALFDMAYHAMLGRLEFLATAQGFTS